MPFTTICGGSLLTDIGIIAQCSQSIPGSEMFHVFLTGSVLLVVLLLKLELSEIPHFHLIINNDISTRCHPKLGQVEILKDFKGTKHSIFSEFSVKQYFCISTLPYESCSSGPILPISQTLSPILHP